MKNTQIYATYTLGFITQGTAQRILKRCRKICAQECMER